MSSSKGFHTTKICLNNIKKTYKRDTQHRKKEGRQNERYGKLKLSTLRINQTIQKKMIIRLRKYYAKVFRVYNV